MINVTKSLSDRYCHSMIFFLYLRRDCRQILASPIYYYLHVLHTHGPLMLMRNTGSAICHTSKHQTTKFTPTQTHTSTQSHANTLQYIKGASVMQSALSCLHFGPADETCVGDTLRTIKSVSGCSAFITF